MAGGWRAAYVVTAVSALYFNVFMLIMQPSRSAGGIGADAVGPPFAITQLIVLLAFLALGYWRWSGFAKRLVLWLNNFCEPLFEVFQDDRLTGEDLARGGREIEPGGAIDLGK